jgi:hypothetical protein
MKENRIQNVQDIFNDPSIRVIGIAADPNQGKSNLIYHLIEVFKTKYQNVKMYSYGLRVQVEGVRDIHTIYELENINNSVIFVDEFFDMMNMGNRKQAERAEKTLRTIYHSNNIMILCGLPRNYNKFVSGMLQACIFKQSTLEDFIQRSTLQQCMMAYSGGFQVTKGQYLLKMPKNVALVWMGGKHFDEVEIPYEEYGDTKRFNLPILTPKMEEPKKIKNR